MAAYSWQDDGSLGTKEILAAVGAVIASYNRCEISLLALLDTLITQPQGIGRKAYALLGTAFRLDLMEEAAAFNSRTEIMPLIKAYSSHYSICSGNRNIIAHAYYTREDLDIPGSDYVLQKYPRATTARYNTFPANECKYCRSPMTAGKPPN